MRLSEMVAISRCMQVNFSFDIVSKLNTSLIIGTYTFNPAQPNPHSFQYSAAFIAQSTVPPPYELPTKAAPPFTGTVLWTFVDVALAFGLARTSAGVVINPT